MANLFINGKNVGEITLNKVADSWGFGEFAPNDAFAEFAPLFGAWTLLMHAEDDVDCMSSAATEELHQAEAALDSLRVRLFRPDRDEWIDVGQLNIDGRLIEWKSLARHRKPSDG